MARRSVASPRFMAIPQAAVRATLQAVRGALYELRAKKGRTPQAPRGEAGQGKGRARKACTLETVADLNSLCKASKQAARDVMWKASTQRYMKDYLRNAVLSRRDLLEGRDICRGFIRFDLWERGKLRHISAVHFPERVVQKSLSQNALVPAIVPHARIRELRQHQGARHRLRP